MQVTVKEAATMLAVSEKTIYRWIKQSAIPHYKINEQYRFNRTELLEWATAQRMQVSPDIFVESGESTAFLPSLVEAIMAGGIIYRLSGKDQASVLKSIVDSIKLPEEVDRTFLYQVLLARETLGSTGIGDGIAIPHVRNPVVLHLSKPTVTLCFLENPIDFKALDGKPVNVLFTITSPTVRAHLHLLSRVGFVLHDRNLKDALLRQAPREELLDLLARAEAEIPEANK
ncbi:MAG: PTS sugar transporter subunit IIA [Spirochaetes bacterium]|nr:PTS sugar transporter subunit IIA [Spirochaetota bacterium]